MERMTVLLGLRDWGVEWGELCQTQAGGTHWGVFVRRGAICWTQNQDAHARDRTARSASRKQPGLEAWISG